MTKIVVAMPTRGMVCTATVLGMIANLERHIDTDRRWDVTMSIGLPIPDAHTFVVENALRMDATHIWLLEEDVIPPEGLLEEMLALNAPVVASDYPQPFGESVIGRKDGRIFMVSTGCLLIKREVFAALKKPWFDTTRDMHMEKQGDKWVPVIEENKPHAYGGQEIFFSTRLLEAGIPIVETKQTCGHVKFENVNFTAQNRGFHTISTLIEITKPIGDGYDLPSK